LPLDPELPLPALAAPLPLLLPPPLWRPQPPMLAPLQSRGRNTAAASSAAVMSPAALPVASPPGVAASFCASCGEPCSPLPGDDASASTIHLGMTSVDAGYATSVANATTPATIAALRITPQ
jgi:hypothetical protein